MSDPTVDLPERLQVAGATDLERRLLAAAAREHPSPESSQRMAAAIGLSAAALGATVTTSTLATSAAGAKAASSSLVLPWLSAGALVLTVTGVIVGARLWTSPQPAPPANSPAVTSPTPPSSSPTAPAQTAPVLPLPAPVSPSATAHRRPAAAPAADLREQIEMVDGARAAIAAGAGDRALELLRRYQARYPSGSFRPEASALQIEALAKLGRMGEARALAQRFLADHGGSPLADRVARVAGLARR